MILRIRPQVSRAENGRPAGIDDAGQVVGISEFPSPPIPVPEPSTWAMMLGGGAGLAFRLSPTKSRRRQLFRVICIWVEPRDRHCEP